MGGDQASIGTLLLAHRLHGVNTGLLQEQLGIAHQRLQLHIGGVVLLDLQQLAEKSSFQHQHCYDRDQ